MTLIVILHWIEDEWRVWAIRRGTPDTTAFLLWDQAVHFGVLLALSPSLTGTRPESWVILAIGAVLLAHFTSVLIYFVENDLGDTSTVLARRKYTFMGERLAAAALILLPAPWFLSVFLWIVWLVVARIRHASDRSWVHVIIACAPLKS